MDDVKDNILEALVLGGLHRIDFKEELPVDTSSSETYFIIRFDMKSKNLIE